MVALSGCGSKKAPPQAGAASEEAATTIAPAAGIDGPRIAAVAAEPGVWLSHGRGYAEQRYSPLEQVNDGNVTELSLAWYYDLDYNRGQEATPLVVDGVMYTTGAWSVVYALDAATGKLI
jgi:quinohemoprotein ethanol dehydrogenase